jgi:phosphatidylserine/phosphatidylglycerophosphate/cardiolipin synthase-like enzyme
MATYYNDAKCDIYIGKGAGKKLLEDIKRARTSIKIVSPYLSPFLISQLIELNERQLSIQLITTDNIEDFRTGFKKNIHKLIKQNRVVDEYAQERRNGWRSMVKVLIIISILLLAILITAVYFTKDLKLVIGLVPIAAILLIIALYRRKIRNMRIYSYWYSQLFPFKVFSSIHEADYKETFIHSKIYLIDDTIAYLGSLNFTSSGTKFNHETRVRITDQKAVDKIIVEFDSLMNNTELSTKDIQEWGRQLYTEPIN